MSRFFVAAVVLSGCGAGVGGHVRRAANALIEAQDVTCDAWELFEITPEDIRQRGERRGVLGYALTYEEQLRIAEGGGLYVASCPSFACGPVAVAVCEDGPESCLGVADNFLPILCIIPTY